MLALALLGIAFAATRRRWPVLALLPFQLSLTATYTMFFAEPRYRLPIEMLAFPFVVFALGELVGLGRAVARRDWAHTTRWRTGWLAGLVTLLVWWIGWPRVVEAGQRLRARHRWGTAEVTLATEPRPRLLLWRPAPPLAPVSPLAGAPEGVHLRAGPDGAARAQVRLAGGPLPAGSYVLAARVTPQRGGGHVRLAGTDVDLGAGPAVDLHAPVAHAGGVLAFDASFAASPGDEIRIDHLALAR